MLKKIAPDINHLADMIWGEDYYDETEIDEFATAIDVDLGLYQLDSRKRYDPELEELRLKFIKILADWESIR